MIWLPGSGGRHILPGAGVLVAPGARGRHRRARRARARDTAEGRGPNPLRRQRIRCPRPFPDRIPYGFSKVAQPAIGRGLAETTGSTGVTVDSVLPGPARVETQSARLRPLTRDEGRPVDAPKRETSAVRKTSSLLDRYTTPEEVAHLVCHVCSPTSVAANGAARRADGGIVRNYT